MLKLNTLQKNNENTHHQMKGVHDSNLIRLFFPNVLKAFKKSNAHTIWINNGELLSPPRLDF